MDLFDAHAHLQDAAFAADLDGVFRRAAAAGVRRVVVNGTSPRDWDAVAALAARTAAVAPAFGVHPWFPDGLPADWLDDLARRLAADSAATVGEIGLDTAVEPRDDRLQEEVFLAQLRLARNLRRPATLHCRRAWGRMLELLRAEGPHPVGLVLHSYGGGADLVPQLAALNACFSFSGTITYTRNTRSAAAARAVPPDRLLAETDAPDLPPEGAPAGPAGGPANEPANLPLVVAAIARARGVSMASAAALTSANAARLFGASRVAVP
ncbi:MAG: TatD family hydrolase [Verrucomicrobia bacterium]|nr:TatD family hydrolase [Verrucomicrobiota bacterium]